MRNFLKLVCGVVCLGAVTTMAQEGTDAPADLAHLNRELQQTRAELADSRKEIEELKQGLEALKKQVQANQVQANQIQGSQGTEPSGTAPQSTENSSSSQTASALPVPTAEAADKDVAFLAAKVNEMHQDKVESASKYPVKLSGLVLFNSYWNKGTLDMQDLPSFVLPNFPGAPNPGIGATFRQTLLGLTAHGPKLFGAQTSADVEIDFAGGSPTTSFGTSTGLVRLRTARVSLDWENTTLNLGQDNLFFSPLSPTSYASVFEPAFSWSGNLWTWTPAIELEHRIALGRESSLVLQGSVLDPLTEETPELEQRNSNWAEATRAPQIAGRIAFDRSKNTRYPITIGFAGSRDQQQYGTFPTVAGWTVNGDVKAGFGSHLELSGEWYTGQAVGGLGGGIWTSVVYPSPDEYLTAIQPLRSTGGWAQLKVIPEAHFEINGAFGQDENFGKDLRVFAEPITAAGFTPMQKNRTELVNFIYKPTSVLLFAVEYRHLFTAAPTGEGRVGDHLNVAAGVRF